MLSQPVAASYSFSGSTDSCEDYGYDSGSQDLPDALGEIQEGLFTPYIVAQDGADKTGLQVITPPQEGDVPSACLGDSFEADVTLSCLNIDTNEETPVPNAPVTVSASPAGAQVSQSAPSTDSEGNVGVTVTSIIQGTYTVSLSAISEACEGGAAEGQFDVKFKVCDAPPQEVGCCALNGKITKQDAAQSECGDSQWYTQNQCQTGCCMVGGSNKVIGENVAQGWCTGETRTNLWTAGACPVDEGEVCCRQRDSASIVKGNLCVGEGKTKLDINYCNVGCCSDESGKNGYQTEKALCPSGKVWDTGQCK